MVVCVAETLPRSVLLDRNLPGLWRLLATRPQEGGEEALLVMTRARKRQDQAEEIWLASRMTATGKPLVDSSLDGVLPTAQGPNAAAVEFNKSGREKKWLMGVM